MNYMASLRESDSISLVARRESGLTCLYLARLAVLSVILFCSCHAQLDAACSA